MVAADRAKVGEGDRVGMAANRKKKFKENAKDTIKYSKCRDVIIVGT